jgi:RNA polymerase sigma factor (sigma-70 family)
VGCALPCAAGDYYLARACEAGVPGAWERLERDLRKLLWSFLRARGASRDDAASLVDETWGALASPPPSGGANTALGTYDGRGSLRAWISTVLWRRLCDRWRAKAGQAPPGPEPDTVAVDDDPARRLADAETGRLLGDALEDAWPRLTRKELEAVVMKYRHDLPQATIAEVLKVGAPRVTRLLQSAARRLRASIESRLGAVPSVGGSEYAWSEVGAAVARLLGRAETESEAKSAPSRRSVDG